MITYQWSVVGGDDIEGAMDRTYMLTQTETGKAMSVTANYTDNLGSEETPFTQNPTLVIDADGISTAIEDAAPNNGDGNGDGIKDRFQSSVISIPGAISGTYITIESKTNNCPFILNSVGVITEPALAPNGDPEGYEYESGLIRLSLQCSQSDMEVLFHGLTVAPTQIRKYGKTLTSPEENLWYDMVGSSENLATILPISINGKTVYKAIYTLIDGELGDDDLTINGVIIDPMGVGIIEQDTDPTNPVQGQVKPIPTLSEWAQYLLIGLLAIAGVGVHERKTQHDYKKPVKNRRF